MNIQGWFPLALTGWEFVKTQIAGPYPLGFWLNKPEADDVPHDAHAAGPAITLEETVN